jgi:peptide/nickel transport system permease protein
MLAAHYHNRGSTSAARLCLIGYSVPVFWLGLIGLLCSMPSWAGWPGRGASMTCPLHAGQLEQPVLVMRCARATSKRPERCHATLLPAALLGYFSLAYISRMTRAFFLEELGREYVMTARIKGASELRVLLVHVLPNVLAPLVTVIALSYGVLLEGAVLTETVFLLARHRPVHHQSLFTPYPLRRAGRHPAGGILLRGTQHRQRPFATWWTRESDEHRRRGC